MNFNETNIDTDQVFMPLDLFETYEYSLDSIDRAVWEIKENFSYLCTPKTIKKTKTNES
jgi:hypothetical protein